MKSFRELLESARASGEPAAIPGAFNALCAIAVRDAGFGVCYISGAATSVSAGVPDVGLLTLDHFARAVREAADACGLPILADADTGFGEAEMVRRTVVEYHRAGAAGLHLEDQVFPKRCGHLDGKALIPLDHAAEKIAAAARAARDCSGDEGMVVCARTDARSVEGMAGVVERAAAYVEAGAEMVFPEGLASEEEFAVVARELGSVRTPAGRAPWMLANMTEFGRTPSITLARFGELGYHAVIYPVTTLRIAMGAVARALETLRREGSAASLLDSMQTREELYRAIGYTPGREWDFPASGPRRE